MNSQNYVTPEISYINRIPDYSSFKLKNKETKNFRQSELPNIKEENTSLNVSSKKQPVKKKLSKPKIKSKPEKKNLKRKPKESNIKTESSNYIGLFDIIMKELSDIPNGIREKVSKIDIKIFDDKLVKIRKRKKSKKSKLSFEQQIKKLNVCTYNCCEQELKFDLNKGSNINMIN